MKKPIAWRSAVLSTTMWTSLVMAQSHQNAELGQFLQEFHQNPSQVMDQLPAKTAKQASLFNQSDKEDNQFVAKKDLNRAQVLQVQGRAGMQYNDLAENLVDNGRDLISNLGEMDEKELQKAQLAESPWSDDYWAIAKGILGSRYADPDKNETFDWKDNFEFTKTNPVTDYITNGNIDYLSPSEKYDLLMGDENYTLTKKMWAEGKSYYDQSGKVEDWMGICHGWAPAAYMVERPTNSVKVKDVTGKHEITFFPSDLKALSSLLWANGRTNSNFIGGRCNAKNPAKDRATGRVTDQECFDTNPGSWHKAVVNQIGVSKRSFVIDATYDYEVWNQPVFAYSYRYFNVETGETATTYDKAVIKLADFSKDKFKDFRDSKTKKIVGVEMRLEYVVETQPSHSKTDSSNRDATNTALYRYDLELDAKGNIVGGEWYSNAHPDFLWTPPVGEKVRTSVDRYMNGKTLEDVVTKGSRFSSRTSAQGLPLPLVIEKLIKESRTEK